MARMHRPLYVSIGHFSPLALPTLLAVKIEFNNVQHNQNCFLLGPEGVFFIFYRVPKRGHCGRAGVKICANNFGLVTIIVK